MTHFSQKSTSRYRLNPTWLTVFALCCVLLSMTGCDQAPVSDPTAAPLPTSAPEPTLPPEPTEAPIQAAEPTAEASATPETPPTAEAMPLPETSTAPEGWKRYTAQEIEIWLPATWQEWEITPDNLQTVLDTLKQSAPLLANQLELAMQQGNVADMMHLYAYDAENPVASMNIISQPIPEELSQIVLSPDTLMPFLEKAYVDMGGENISRQSGFEINGMKAAQIGVDVTYDAPESGSVAVRAYQYAILHDSRFYVITFSMPQDADGFPELFAQIAGSFKINAE